MHNFVQNWQRFHVFHDVIQAKSYQFEVFVDKIQYPKIEHIDGNYVYDVHPVTRI